MDYYCSTKFTDLMISVQSRLLYNCCKAYPERLNVDWLEKNPGRLFHTDTMLEDRGLMLQNKSCVSCHHGCYKHEEQGVVSPRQQMANNQIKRSNDSITDPNAPLKDLTISLTTDCNMACVYCSPEWSTTWQREVDKDGPYVMEGHQIKNNNWNKLWRNLKQKSRGADTKFFKLILNEIKLAKELEIITLIGGEPLLNNQIEELLETAKGKRIKIVTGLGVNRQRLAKLLEKTKGLPILWKVSGESTGDFFEFIRYGLDWDDFKKKIEMINNANHDLEFQVTMSNLSAFDFHNFYKTFGDFPMNVLAVSGMPYLSPHVLDKDSKDRCFETLDKMGGKPKAIAKWLQAESSDIDRRNLGTYLKQLKSRRTVDLGIFPKSFLNWSGAERPN